MTILFYFLKIVMLVSVVNSSGLFEDLNQISFKTNEEYNTISSDHYSKVDKRSKLKYILLWTVDDILFHDIEEGQQAFLGRRCFHVNCHVSSKKNILENLTNFDVIAFPAKDLSKLSKSMLPKHRLPYQKYVFVSSEPTTITDEFDGYFNWTWTFKLDSDLTLGRVVVADVDGNIVGPNTTVAWIKRDDMSPVKKDLMTILRWKNKAVAWIASKCDTPSKRKNKVEELNNVLSTKYGIDVDVYGECGTFKCAEGGHCDELIRKDYFFYLAYEPVLSEDYVTEELLRAVKYNALPIVYGGANYSRFLPEGSYLNSMDFTTEELADKIYSLIYNFPQYVEYFKWTNHYNYFSSLEHEQTNEFCKICSLLNEQSRVKKYSVYNHLREWWNYVKYKSEYNKYQIETLAPNNNVANSKDYDFDLTDVPRLLGLPHVFFAMKHYFQKVHDRYVLQRKLDDLM